MRVICQRYEKLWDKFECGKKFQDESKNKIFWKQNQCWVLINQIDSIEQSIDNDDYSYKMCEENDLIHFSRYRRRTNSNDKL